MALSSQDRDLIGLGFLAVLQKLDVIIGKLNAIQQTEKGLRMDLTDVQARVTQNTSVVDSAIDLLNSISQQLKDAIASNDPAAVQAVVDQLDANNSALAEAVAANTPAAPTA